MDFKHQPTEAAVVVAGIECPICYNETKEQDQTACDRCRFVCCRTCFCQHVLSNETDPKCLNADCATTIPFHRIVASTTSSWRKDAYRPFRKTVLLRLEMAKMDDTSPTSAAYLAAQSVKAECDYKHYDDSVVANAEACIEKYGVGWEAFDFGTGTGVIKGRCNFRCPVANCMGFIDGESMTCNWCRSRVCEQCHEVRRERHVCDPDTLASVRAIFQQAKPCPKCFVMISKVDGCDQMFCTQCHTTFSWLTGQLLRNNVDHGLDFDEVFYVSSHRNPRRARTIERLMPNEELECQSFISYENLLRCFTNEQMEEGRRLRGNLPKVQDICAPLGTEANYFVAFLHLRQVILNVRATSGNHANVQPLDHRELRVQLQVNEIDRETFANRVVDREMEYRTFLDYSQVYMTVFQMASIIFDNLFAYRCNRLPHGVWPKLKKQYATPIDFMHECYLQLQHVLELANERLAYFDSVYGKDARFVQYSRHPYSALNVKLT